MSTTKKVVNAAFVALTGLVAVVAIYQIFTRASSPLVGVGIAIGMLLMAVAVSVFVAFLAKGLDERKDRRASENDA